MNIWYTALAILLVLFLLYKYAKYRWFSLEPGLPGLEPEFILGSLRHMGLFQGRTLSQAQLIWQQTFGDKFLVMMGPTKLRAFCNIEHAQTIFTNRKQLDQSITTSTRLSQLFPTGLINLIGMDHKRVARIILPMLKKHKVLPHLDTMLDEADQFIIQWKKLYNNDTDNINNNFFNDYSKLFLNIFGLFAFDHEFNLINRISKVDYNSSLENNIDYDKLTLGEATQILIETYNKSTLLPVSPKIINLLLWLNKPYRKCRAIVRNYVEKLVEDYKQKKLLEQTHNGNNNTNNSNDNKEDDESIPAVKQNLFSQLMSNLQLDETAEARKPASERVGLTKAELIDNLIMLIFAGYETTATTLSWATYYLSKHPQVQYKIKEELSRFIQPNQRLTASILHELQYLDCVVKELLRLAPIVPGVQRATTEPMTLDGVNLNTGDDIYMATYCLHVDRRYWKLDPFQFIPERFYGPNAPDRNHNVWAYLPFGGGNHACAGQETARLQVKAIIARLMQSVTFIDTPENTGEELQRMTCIPKHLVVKMKFDN